MSELYIGLMSGTSMDAIDGVLVDFSNGLRLLGSHSAPLPEALRAEIAALCLPGNDEIERMGRLDAELGRRFAAVALATLETAGVTPASVRAIGSHGQTIRHRPAVEPPFTLQIADPNTIAEHTGITVVADFRRRDMAAGGQGAPLVPAFHASLFGNTGKDRIVLNLGGIANVTLLPASHPEAVRGHDTGPANILMDAWCLAQRSLPYDAGGEWAASGRVHADLLGRLLAWPYFHRPAPKSTGREEFSLEWLRGQLDALAAEVAAEDVQATLLELTARTVADGVRTSGMAGGELLVCGGGAFNDRLWQRLQALLPGWELRSTADFGLAPTWVEATAFAWLARQALAGLPGNLPAVTGAAGPRVLGSIHPA